MSAGYRAAGVDLDAAEQVTARMAERLGSALFGGFVPVSQLKAYDEPVLVSSIDGVGTKVRLAARLGYVDGLGQDIVHHCAGDIGVHGASPLFFMDYLALHHLDLDRVSRIVDGIADACAALGIRLVGGETAEMPLVYPPGHFDLAGAIVGVVEQSAIIDGRAISEGDILFGLPSSGLHTNGYSLVQRLFSDADLDRYEPDLGTTLGQALLEPHRSYVDEVRALIATGAVHGLAHITGGGIAGNLERIMPADLQAVVELPPPPPLFRLIEERGVALDEMPRIFNMGIGMIAVCDPDIDPRPPFQHIGVVRRATSPQSRRVLVDERH
ncbi:MAG: phosphoribosylformylglycinamidine cyclo-ligase [Chloroflexota bacterium]